jgi:hypothetical protein
MTPRVISPREPPRDLVQVALAIGAPDALGRYPVTCRDPKGQLHKTAVATWREACALAAELFTLIAADMADASRELPPAVNGVHRQG